MPLKERDLRHLKEVILPSFVGPIPVIGNLYSDNDSLSIQDLKCCWHPVKPLSDSSYPFDDDEERWESKPVTKHRILE